MKNFALPVALAILLTIPGAAEAAVIYNEADDGDLSGVFATPTPLTLSPGANTIIGQMGLNGGTGATDGTNDADYITFSITGGNTLSSIFINEFTFSPNDPGSSLLAYTTGAGFTGQGGGDINSSTLFNAASGEVLDDLGGPLGAGTYSFWIQETSDNAVNYTITFTQVPEPTAAFSWLVGISLLGIRRRRG